MVLKCLVMLVDGMLCFVMERLPRSHHFDNTTVKHAGSFVAEPEPITACTKNNKQNLSN